MNDFLPFKTLLANPLITLRRAGLLTLYALLLGLFIPGFLQYNFNTFFPEDIVEKLPPTVKEKVMEFDDTSNALKNSLTTLDRRIALGASAGDPKELSELLGTRRNLETYIKIRKPPFHIAGFYPDPLTLLWPLFYVSFFWLNFLLAPTLKYKRSFGSYVLMFLGLLFFYQWPTWIRNTELLRSANRVVYAGANIDVNMPSFFLQEWNASIVTFCILELLLGWSCYFIQWRKELSVVRKTNRLNNNQVYILLQSLSRQFIHWQVCSVLLACAFVPYTFLFWRYISDYGDMRYLPHALIIHALWAFCWLAVSLPLMQTWYDWTLKQAMFSFQVKEPNESKESDESDEKNEADKFPSSPIGFLNVITTIVVALLTFGSPIIKAVSIGH